ncbi:MULTISPECIES: ComEA family DNA-binding protein [unclassified Streptomyces]|uniref:ComEA family DNA-binding protein n=1 Tax=unclassified Streptomyces TaxID=2593676 RepID=UPI0013168A44|nr:MULTISPECIES: ComEA family DNA-binding protein [unclassified Streptomyces]QHC29431.1 ComEA family DNA-binding protein [Streptomyces sp. HF10]WKE71746.1 ComEA family DNA-binding protein [Streptomyces sp. WP-1]
MALRSRPRTVTPTSGPGRGPASDVRMRHRASEHRRIRHRAHAPAEDLRRRAELLFGEQAVQRRESGKAPPPASTPEPLDRPPQHMDPPPPDRWERAGTALRERLPVWLQSRCGVERRGTVALAVLLVVAALFAVQHFWVGRPEQVSAPQVVRARPTYAKAPGASGGGAAASGGQIVVDVGGKVRAPGIRRLPAGSRVADALRAAGGVRPGVDTDGLNRARFLVDGEQVVVGEPAAVAPAGTAAPSGPAAQVSLNTATEDQLDTLPGVGPVLAHHIVDYRTRHGGFRSVDELRQVNGIGDRRFTDLRDLVRP